MFSSSSFFTILALASLALAQDRTTEAGEAAITDANEECSYYSYPAVEAISSGYPTIWETADLSGAGISDYDKQLFAALNATIPNIAPRGTRDGNFTGVVYDGATDPDCWWTYEKCTTPKLAGLEDDITKCDEPNTWGFTLDDGPNCSHNAYYDYLLSIDQKATLFYIGSNVLDWPLEAQRGLADAHEICAHTYSHPFMTALTNEQAFAELYYSKKAIRDIVGIDVKCWRPPYGDVDDRIRYIANALGMKTVVWEEDTFDWEWETLGIPAVDKNYDTILSNQASGTYSTYGPIVLSHEIDGTTMNISESYLPAIRSAFTGGVMPVAVCMNNTNPYGGSGSSNYTYPDYAQYVAGTHTISLAAPTAVTKDVRLHFTSIMPVSSSGVVSASTTASSAVATSSSKASGTATAASDVASASSKTKTGAGSKTINIQQGSALGVVFGLLGLLL